MHYFLPVCVLFLPLLLGFQSLYNDKRKLYSSLAVGFGSVDKDVGAVAEGTKQCPCCSGLKYSECCQQHHSGTMPSTPLAVTRARYSAYATSNPGFIIDTTHPSHRDYSAYMDKSRDVTKARRSWAKEIISKNSEAFEFLKMEVLDEVVEVEEQQREMELNAHSNYEFEQVTFRVLVRRKEDNQPIPFQETSLYMNARCPDYANDSPLATWGSALSKQKQKSNGDESTGEGRWLYVRGDVGLIDEKNTRRLIAEAPKYTKGSIQEKW